MSGILLRWLNEDLLLKQRVLNLEHDFSNGYLLGEILHAHNHQQNFHLFQDLPTSEARVNNFILLEPSLRLLAIPFDAQVAYGMMQGKAGMANRLLYQVKMALDRLTKFSVPVSMRRTITPAGVKPLPNLAQRTTKPQYDRATHAIFAAAVRGMVQSQKGINLERSLERFRVEGARQKQLVQIEKERSLLAEELHIEAIRVQGLHDLAQRKALCDSWEANNVDDWLVNMGRKRDREIRNHMFLRKVNKARMARLQRARAAGERAVECDLPAFEARSREATRTASGNQEEDEATPWAFEASNRGFLEAGALEKGYKWQMDNFHAKRSEERAGAREKRRRRFTTEREEFLSNEHLKEGMDVLTEKLMRRCQAEEQVERQLESVFRYKAIMTENRQYRTQQYTARADVDAEGLLKRDQASLDSFRRDYQLGVRAQIERCEAAGATRAAAAATRIEKMCRETLEGLIAMSLEVVKYRAYSEHRREPDASAPHQDPMPSLQWKDMKWSFVRGGPLLCMDTVDMAAERNWGLTPLLLLASSEGGASTFCVSDGDEGSVDKVANFLDDCELQDYITESGWWATRREAPSFKAGLNEHDTPVGFTPPVEVLDAKEENAAKSMEASDSASNVQVTAEGNFLATANPLHALGECVIETSLLANPLPTPKPPPDVPKFSLRICMCGRTLAGKSEQAIRLADRYCLKVLSAEELAQRAMDNAANAMAAGRKILTKDEALGQEASSALMQGGTISDKVYAALLVEAIKEIELENCATRAEASASSDSQDMWNDDDRAEYMGWIIDDFPGSAEQAAVLEKHLSGYDETAHVPSRNDAASKLAPPAPVPEITEPNKGSHITSCMDVLIYIDVPRETILKRSLGRLYDPVTGEPYHFEGALPQYDVVCKERLVRPEDPANPSAQLSLQVDAQDKAAEELKAFIEKIGTLRTVESGEGTPDALFGKLNAVVVALLQEGQDKDMVSSTNGDADNVANAQDEFKPAWGGQIPTECVDPDNGTGDVSLGDSTVKREELSDEPQGVSRSDTISSVPENEGDSKQGNGDGLLAGGLAVALSGHWRMAELKFEETARRVFRELRNQRVLCGAHIRSLRDSFSSFLRRSDDKQSVLADLSASFNSIDQDLRFDDRTRKELLLRTEEHRSKLWSDVEERKACAAGVLKSIRRDGWLERQKGMISNHMIVLMQAEVERFHAGTSLLLDYHHAKTQEATRDGPIILAPLLPREPAGDAPNETPGTKSSGKKEKEAKGSGKKGQDGKGNKGNKGDPPGAPLQHLSGRTPWPPSLVLAELVDVVSAGGSSQVDADSNGVGTTTTQGKGAEKGADKGKKSTKKTASKVEAQAVVAVKTPLATALSTVVEYADAWGPRGFPVPPEEETTQSEVEEGGGSVRSRQLPSPLFLHRAVWAQAELLVSRCRLLLRVGEDVSLIVQRKADLVYRELEGYLDTRVSEEARAVEASMAMARECIDSQSAIEHEWRIQGKYFDANKGVRLVPLPHDRSSSPDAVEDLEVFSKVQVLRLREALESVRHAGAEGDDEAVVTPEEASDVLLRLSAEEGALPDCWANVTKGDMLQLSTTVLDPDDIGQVGVEMVVSTVTSNTPGEAILLADEARIDCNEGHRRAAPG